MFVKWEYKSTRIEYHLIIVNSENLNHRSIFYLSVVKCRFTYNAPIGLSALPLEFKHSSLYNINSIVKLIIDNGAFWRIYSNDLST